MTEHVLALVCNHLGTHLLKYVLFDISGIVVLIQIRLPIRHMKLSWRRAHLDMFVHLATRLVYILHLSRICIILVGRQVLNLFFAPFIQGPTLMLLDKVNNRVMLVLDTFKLHG